MIDATQDTYAKTLNTLKWKNRIEDVISNDTKLHKVDLAGKQGRCPICGHDRALFVNMVRQTFHCMKCNKGGDVFQYVSAFKKVDFDGAVKFLEARSGV